ncbi:MAG: hypothetical protein IJ880_15430 [Bacilli bacterium]|nr:hypothetical protein [Bacilli bacterium]
MYSTKTYYEVFYVLSKMEKNLVMMIPIEVLEHIKESSDIEINKNNNVDINNIEYDSAKLLVWLFYNFIATKSEKQKIESLIEDSKRKKYNTENIFNNDTTNTIVPNLDTSNQLIEYKESKIKNILNKILSFLGLK